ncbi:MAG: polymer-forming cytoskeletal protein [Clostridia bacterium]|nr:polymer-forming cytoskeletal protein [Clostridia bacterium]
MKFPKFKQTDIIKIDTLIGKRAVIDGDITGKGNFKIDGTVAGNVTIKGDLVTGDKSTITGDIVAKNIIIAGKVTGNVEASGQLTIKHTGVISGDQKCGSLIVEEGSSLIGKCEISGKTEEENDGIPEEFEDLGDFENPQDAEEIEENKELDD